MTIVAAIDQTEDAELILTEADRLQTAFDEELHIVHARTISEFVDHERQSVETTGEGVPIERVKEGAAEIVREQADGIVSSFEAVGLVGDPADVVTEYIRDVDASYLVIGGRKRSPVGKAVFGSTAQSILLRADRPVVFVRKES